METIKNYLDNVFAYLVDTKEMRSIKAEFLANMEDRYQELKAQGKSEHEIIGIVISEFGNVEELAKEMNIGTTQVKELDTIKQSKLPEIDEQTVESFLSQNKKSTCLIGIGVALCILSPIALLAYIGLGFNEKFMLLYGLTPLIILVAIAVVLFIMAEMRMEKYKCLENPHVLDVNAQIMVQNQQQQFISARITCTAIGVVLCIIGVLPVIISIMMENELVVMLGTCALLVLVATGVYMLVWANLINDGYMKLLSKGDYSPKSIKCNKKIEIVGNIYWLTTTAIYLAWSFITFDWGRSWIIWPIAGVVFAIVAGIITALTKEDAQELS